MSLPAGTRLGPYEVVSPLGAGGMGEVYRAHDTRLGREVAIKVLPPSFSADPDRLRRFEQEARATGMLNHPNILALYDVGTFEESPYLVTELLEGQSLRDEMPLPRRKALDYARQIANGLAAAHAKGVTHRDLKPDNIFITRDGRAKILDFGLAKVEPGARDAEATRTVVTTPGMVMGTVGYTSPEQARGNLADHRSDIFSFGVMFYEMLSGQRAFQRDSAVETLNAIIKDDPPPLADAALDRIVRRCMEKAPEQRFQSASDLAFAIDALSGPLSAATPAAQGGTAAAPRRIGALVAAGAVALALIAGAAAGLWWHARQDARGPVWSGERLTSSGIAYGPRISPDGRTLAFISLEGTQSQVAIMHPGSPNWTVLTHDSGRGEVDHICWSRDGTKIYFGRRDGLYSVPALGGQERLILDHASFAEILADGSFLANRTGPQGRQQLHRIWPESGKVQPMDLEVFGASYPLPDGRQAIIIGRKLSDAKAQVDAQVVDLDSGAVYLGELNPRISGASSMTNVTAGAYADVPLFLFHLLEFMDVDYTVDVEEINDRWRALAAVDVWSQLIMKDPGDDVERILAAPRTGAWRLSDGGALTFEHVTNDWHEITTEDEAFFMRVYGPGDFKFHGADLGILVTKGRMQTAEGLTERCRHYIEGIRAQYKSEPLPQAPPVMPIAYVK